MHLKNCGLLKKKLETPIFKEFITKECKHRANERKMEKRIRKTIPNYRIFVKKKFTQKRCADGLKKMYYIDCMFENENKKENENEGKISKSTSKSKSRDSKSKSKSKSKRARETN